jgi:ankyrin
MLFVSSGRQNGFAPLHIAAEGGHTQLLTLLLRHGASVDQQSSNGLTPLHLAAQEDRVTVAEVLVENGFAKIDLCTKVCN